MWQLEIVLSSMVLHFNGGTGTAWVPLDNAMTKVLQGVQKNGVSAGEKNLQMFVAGMHEASKKHVLAVKRTSTERNVQMKHKEKAEVDDEIKKLSCTLEDERGGALEMKAEFIKTMKANKQLIVDCERNDARYASASASAATNSQHVGKLQKKVESTRG